jgi:aminomuconate-semialdehyde/2-hydroxymuconate-6-semialdehyde dehydrogenase
MKKILNYIDGSYDESFSKDWLDNYNPSKGEVYSKIASSTKADVNSAYLAAK